MSLATDFEKVYDGLIPTVFGKFYSFQNRMVDVLPNYANKAIINTLSANATVYPVGCDTACPEDLGQFTITPVTIELFDYRSVIEVCPKEILKMNDAGGSFAMTGTARNPQNSFVVSAVRSVYENSLKKKVEELIYQSEFTPVLAPAEPTALQLQDGFIQKMLDGSPQGVLTAPIDQCNVMAYLAYLYSISSEDVIFGEYEQEIGSPYIGVSRKTLQFIKLAHKQGYVNSPVLIENPQTKEMWYNGIPIKVSTGIPNDTMFLTTDFNLKVATFSLADFSSEYYIEFDPCRNKNKLHAYFLLGMGIVNLNHCAILSVDATGEDVPTCIENCCPIDVNVISQPAP